MPCDYSKYPKNWEAIRKEILSRADNKCEFCGVGNHAYGYRNNDGKFQFVSLINVSELDGLDIHKWDVKIIQIVLTIAHLNHNTKDSRRANLKALCQRCHNNWDVDHRKKNRSHTLEVKKTHPKQILIFS